MNLNINFFINNFYNKEIENELKNTSYFFSRLNNNDLLKFSNQFLIDIEEINLEYFLKQSYYSIIIELLLLKIINNNNNINLDMYLNQKFDKYINNYNSFRFNKSLINIFSEIGKLEKIIRQINLINLADLSLNLIFEDILKIFYEYIINFNNRLKLGEFYTPYKLTEYIINNEIEIDNNSKYLEPTCGNGIFINTLINKFIFLKKFNKDTVGNIKGYDINPNAILTATFYFYFLLYKYNININNIKSPFFIKNIIIDNNTDNEKFNCIIGNPPWVLFKNLSKKNKNKILENKQKYIEILKNIKNTGGNSINISLLVLFETIKNYLGINGKIIFILPESILYNENYKSFRNMISKNIIDIEKIIEPANSEKLFKNNINKNIKEKYIILKLKKLKEF